MSSIVTRGSPGLVELPTCAAGSLTWDPKRLCERLVDTDTRRLRDSLAELHYNLLSPLLSIPPDCLICMNEEGAQLREDVVTELTELAVQHGSVEQTRGRYAAQDDTVDSSLAGGMGTGKVGAGVGDAHVERRIYVFDREHLDSDPDEVAAALAVREADVLGEPELGRESCAWPTGSRHSLAAH